MSLRSLLRRMGITPDNRKKKKKRELEGPPVDKMMRKDEERTFVVTK